MLPLFSFVIYWLATEHGHVARLLSTRVLCTLGDWSYAFYLLHSFVYVIIGNRLRPSGLLGRPSGVLIAVSLSFVVATCASALAHTVIELPAQRRLHRRWRLGNLAPPSTTELEPAAA
jgi:peptidoglycan/LPS O-acetylase OafA/YrhL